MLYNPAWETRTDPLSLEGLIAWLEKQPAHKTYKYTDRDNCLAAQYLTSIGEPYDIIPFVATKPRGHASFRRKLEWIAVQTRTFGGALKVARNYSQPKRRK